MAGVAVLATLVVTVLAALPAPASAQYFGRNKVQYDDFQFRVLETPHFEIHYYPVEGEAAEDMARMSERWYERYARTFQHEFDRSKPLILYADHPDFQQTNTLSGFIGEGTGGVTESMKNRVIMPLTGSYADNDHVLGHELVHAFQYNIAQSRRGGGLQGLGSLPLWLIEGMAEYLSLGREDPLTAMWLRDALLRDDFPTIEDMTKEQRFFPYRFGEALWAYVGGTYGDDAVIQVFRRALRIGFDSAIEQVLGIDSDTLSVEWERRVQETYGPLMEGRQNPADVGHLLLAPSTGSGEQNLAPILSPDGRFVAFLSEKDLFSVDLFLADARTGEIIRKLTSASANPHIDALRYTESSGSFSPDGTQFVFVVFAGGDNELSIVDTDDGDLVRTFKPQGMGSINNPAWSPDGRTIAFTGMVGGISDLYLYDLETQEVRQLTDDKYGDFHPAWSPDGSTLAFSSDRGSATDFNVLAFGEPQIALLDVATRQVRTLDVFGNVRHSNPQFSRDGQRIYFLSDQDGFTDIYRMALQGGSVERITRVKTGVSGITGQSPAMSVAARTGELAFSVFDEFEFHVYTLPADPPGTPESVVADALDDTGRILPPTEPDRLSRVTAYLADPRTGLDPAEAYQVADAADYSPSLALDFVGQPSFGVGADRFGNYIGGGASAYFSDMLGDRILGVAVQAQGTIKDIGGQAFYADLSDRWNWAAAGGHIPYLMVYQRFGRTPAPEEQPYLALQRLRMFVTSAQGQVAYPFSSTRRMEFGGGAIRYAYDVEEDRYFLNSTGQFYTGQVERVQVDVRCEDADEADLNLLLCEPDPLNLAQASAAYVGDNAFFGFTSPIRGGRFRFSMEGTVGTENFLTGIADWRRYYSPHRNLTVALRGLHIGRYGQIESDIIRPLFLGYETFIRGYASESFEPEECTRSAEQAPRGDECPTFNRLFGHRLGVANLEVRIPFIGVEQFGIIDFGFLPTELVAFADAGLAWDGDNEPKLEFSRSSVERVPVFSTGVSARFNVLGMLVLEAYYVYPFQRPDKNGHWGFQIAPGW